MSVSLWPEELKDGLVPASVFDATGAVRPHVAYQKDPIAWAQDKLGIPRHTLVWSLNKGYAGHQWDGDVNPIAQLFQAAADGQDCAVESATTTGKSFGVAVLVLWFSACWAGARTFTFAPKEDQLRLFVWTEIGKLWPAFKRHFPTATLTDLCLRMNGGIDDSWGAWGYAVGIRAGEDIATKAAGMHAPDMMLIYEETPGIPKQVMAAGENTATAAHNFRIAVGNPNSQTDTLHQFAVTPGVKHLRISALDHPNIVTGNPSLIPGGVSQASIDRRRLKYGETSPVYQSRVRGISPEQASDALIRREWLERSATRHAVTMDLVARGTVDPLKVDAIGVDVANSEHGDRKCEVLGAGRVVVAIAAAQCPDANALGRQVHLRMKAGGILPQRVGVDATGVGAGTVNELHRLGARAVQALHNGGAPMKHVEKAPDGGRTDWLHDDNLFRLFRDQAYWQLREDFRLNRIDVPKDEELWEELVCPTFVDEPKTTVEPKDEIRAKLGRSPDKADALVLWNWVRPRRMEDESDGIATKTPHKADPWTIKDGHAVKRDREPTSAAELVDRLLGKKERTQGRVPMRTLVPPKR